MNDTRVSSEELSEAEAAAVFDEGTPALPLDREQEQVPEWAVLPKDLKVPLGEQVAFMRIPGRWQRAKRDRVCILWPITEVEERTAYARARGDSVRAVTELSKMCIRAIDGIKADWTGDMAHPANVNKFWETIGPKGRLMVRNYYVQTHTVSTEDQTDFFVNHFCVTTAGG